MRGVACAAGTPAPSSQRNTPLGLTPRLVRAAAFGKTLEEVRKKATELATDAWMYEQPRSNLAVLSQLAPPKRSS